MPFLFEAMRLSSSAFYFRSARKMSNYKMPAHSVKPPKTRVFSRFFAVGVASIYELAVML